MGEELRGNAGNIAISEAAFDLEPETTYYARAVAEGLAGTARGKILAFSTTKRVYTKEEEEIKDAEAEYELTAKAKKGTPGDFYGMDWSGDLRKMAEEESFGTMKTLGSKWFRLKLAKGEPFEARAQYAIEKALEKGLHVVAYLGDGPFPLEETTARANALTFATRMVETYLPKGVTTFEVWNEPNMPFPLKPGDSEPTVEHERVVNAPHFAVFLEQMSNAIKAGAKGSPVTVLGPGLFGYRTNECPEEDPKRCHVTPRRFLKEINAAGAKSYYDAVSLHPYVFRVGRRGEQKHTPGLELNDARLVREAVRNDLVQIKFDQKPVWVTEIGFPVENTENATAIPPVSESFQKFLLRSTFALMANRRQKYNIENVMYYNIQDVNQSPIIWEQHCGLLRANDPGVQRGVSTKHSRIPESTRVRDLSGSASRLRR